VQAQGRINNSAVQQLCKVSKATATRYLSELEKEKYLHKTGSPEPGPGIRCKGPEWAHDWSGTVQASGQNFDQRIPFKRRYCLLISRSKVMNIYAVPALLENFNFKQKLQFEVPS
jgi:hypothetical protein